MRYCIIVVNYPPLIYGFPGIFLVNVMKTTKNLSQEGLQVEI
jgi:hypothetical protein